MRHAYSTAVIHVLKKKKMPKFKDLPPHQSYKSALVLTPPEHVCSLIERIREEHDKRFRRWMPHITLSFPFINIDQSTDRLDAVAATVEQVTSRFEPFDLTLDKFQWFTHSKHSRTLYLAPDAHSKRFLQDFVNALAEQLPQYNDVLREGVFTPHLSLGQFRGVAEIEQVIRECAELVTTEGQVRFHVTDFQWVTRKGFKDRMMIRRHFHLKQCT